MFKWEDGQRDEVGSSPFYEKADRILQEAGAVL